MNAIDKKFAKMSRKCANSTWSGTGTGLKKKASKPRKPKKQ